MGLHPLIRELTTPTSPNSTANPAAPSLLIYLLSIFSETSVHFSFMIKIVRWVGFFAFCKIHFLIAPVHCWNDYNAFRNRSHHGYQTSCPPAINRANNHTHCSNDKFIYLLSTYIGLIVEMYKASNLFYNHHKSFDLMGLSLSEGLFT